MTISSVVIKINSPQHTSGVVSLVGEFGECEVVAYEADRVVALIEAPDTQRQVEVFKALQNLSGVRDVALIYDYKDLSQEAAAVESADAAKAVREIDQTPAESVRYNGNPKV